MYMVSLGILVLEACTLLFRLSELSPLLSWIIQIRCGYHFLNLMLNIVLCIAMKYTMKANLIRPQITKTDITDDGSFSVYKISQNTFFLSIVLLIGTYFSG